jgi:hypothetical protein
MTFKEKQEQLAESNPEALFADGFEDALVGMGTVFSKGPIAIYDYEKCAQILMKRDGMTWEEAVEFIDFNVTGAYVGEHTPAFITFFENPPEKRRVKKVKRKRKVHA